MSQNTDDLERLRKRIRCAKGEIPSDIVLKNGIIANVFVGEFQEADIAIYDGIVVGIGQNYTGKEEVDIRGAYALPGFIDAHMHIESSMLTPSRLSEAVISHGTTCIVADPHEIANVMGREGIRFMFEDASNADVDFLFMLSSCVPATHLDTSGAIINAEDLSEFLKDPHVLGLAEMMNYPGVLNGDEEVLKKILLFQHRNIDGHCPGLSGKELQAYISALIGSDHESIDPEEALEKIEKGMFLMIREGSTAKNMEALLPIVNSKNFHRCCFVSDDLHPDDIQKRGHMDFILKKAISLGLDPIKAVQMATINPALHFNMKDRGTIAPGKRADIVVVDNLNHLEVLHVYKDGKRIKGSGNNISSKKFNNTIRIKEISKEKFKIFYREGGARVIEIVPEQIVNRAIILDPSHEDGGEVVSDTERDILKICVIERHKNTGNVGVGLVKGFGLQRGAIASSISHDSHNIIAVGVSDEDIYRAVVEIKEMGGGISISCNNKIIAKIRLEIGGLMTDRSLLELLGDMQELNKAIKQIGSKIENPFMALSFLALPVIPELRITDKGLVDVNRFEIVPLFLS